jgi:hypothetical protein
MKDQNIIDIIEFIFPVKNNVKKVYCPMVFGLDVNYAFKKNNNLLFFSSREESAEIYKLRKLTNKFSMPDGIILTVNISKTISLINKMNIDNSATILNYLNVSEDLLQTIKKEFPPRYIKSLYEFANYLTFHRNLKVFFNESSYKIINNSFIYDKKLKNKFANLSDYLGR